MNDIIKRLRELAAQECPNDGIPTIKAGDELREAATEIERLRDIITLSYMELAQYFNSIQGARENSRRAESVLDMGTNHWKLPDDLAPLRVKLGVVPASPQSTEKADG